MELDNPILQFAMTVRALRKGRDLSLREFAKKSGKSFSCVTQIERGKRLPTVRTIRAVAKALANTEEQAAQLEASLLSYRRSADMGSDLIDLKNKFDTCHFDSSPVMPKEFLERLQEDCMAVKKKKDVKIPLEAKEALSGAKILLNHEIIEIAKRLGQPAEDYLYLANYLPFKKPLGEENLTLASDIFRKLGKLKEEELSSALRSIHEILRYFGEKKNTKIAAGQS